MRVSALRVGHRCVWLTAIDASAQPIQLPTFYLAGVSTTVMVPDGGAAFLGGINHARTAGASSACRGCRFPVSRTAASARTRSASSFWVTATIHDFDAMDQALLNTPSPDGVADLSQHSPVCRKALAVPDVSRVIRSISAGTGRSNRIRRRP